MSDEKKNRRGEKVKREGINSGGKEIENEREKKRKVVVECNKII
jgi:hypothetical protein